MNARSEAVGSVARAGARLRGLFVVVLGPDGAGKTTLINALIRHFASAAIPVRAFHLRPQDAWDPQHDSPVTNPYGRKARSAVVSALKLLYLLVAYNVGYWLHIRRSLRHRGLVLFDRYLHDLSIDPRRYRFSGAGWWAGLVLRMVPAPDLWIVLQGPTDVLRARKQEVAAAETALQNAAYQRFARSQPNATAIDCSLPLEEVMRRASGAITARWR